MSQIVISYRRSDSEAMTGRIHDCLVDHYGEEAVYRDLESVPLGKDYRSHIRGAIRRADLLIAVVGPKWSGPKRGGGKRIKEPKDTVRAEIEAAIEHRVPIIPVLVHDAEMPVAADLPADIREFAYQNAAVIDAGQDFRTHMDRLISQTDRILKHGRAIQPPSLLRSKRLAAVPASYVVVAMVSAACAALLAALWAFAPRHQEAGEQEVSRGAGWAPPPNRGYWKVGDSIVYLEPTATQRQFFFVEPSAEMLQSGAQPGSLLFEGSIQYDATNGDRYLGRLYGYYGKCGPHSYAAEGPVHAGPEVVLTGNAPRYNGNTCEQLDDQKTTLVLQFKERK